VGEKTVLGYAIYRFDLYDTSGRKKQTFYLRWTGFDYENLYSPMFLLGNLNTDLASKIEYDFSAVALTQYDVAFWNDYRIYIPTSTRVFLESGLPVWSNMREASQDVHFQGLRTVSDDAIDFSTFPTFERNRSNHLTLTFLFYINPDDRPGKSDVHRELFIVEEGGICWQDGYLPQAEYLQELCDHAQYLFDKWFEKNRSKLLNSNTREWVEYGIQAIESDLLQLEQETRFGQDKEKLDWFRTQRNKDQ
jgi:hypothetical protein